MICQQLSLLLGLACHPLNDDGSVVIVETPFKFDDGDHISVYVESVGNQFRFFDDGATFMHFVGLGLSLQSAHQTRFLKTVAEAYGGSFNSDGEIELWAKESESAEAFARYITAMLSVVRWERERKSVDHDIDLFVEEVALYLAAWKGTDVIRRPKVQGITGREYEFDFDVAGLFVLAVSTHHQSTSAALHKLVDVKGLPSNAGLKTLVVIDDRADQKTAKNESMVLSSVSGVIGMEQLQRNAGAGAAVH